MTAGNRRTVSNTNRTLLLFAIVCISLTRTASAVTPARPVGVNAKPTSTTHIDVTWTAVSGATSYQVDRKDPVGRVFVQVGTPATNAFPDSNVSPDTAYVYRVRAVSGASMSLNSAQELATSVMLTDNPLAAGVIPVKGEHLVQVRAAINAVRALVNLPVASTTDQVVTGTTNVKAVHITELRDAVDEARTELGFSIGGYTNSPLAGKAIKAVDMQELRDSAGTTEQIWGTAVPTVTLSPSDANISPGASLDYTVSLEEPAAADTTINLSVVPGNAGVAPASVTIPAGQSAATFTYTDAGATTSTVTVTATLGTYSTHTTVTAAPPPRLVINEVDYDSVGTDNTEYLEIYNSTAAAIDLTNITVYLVNGAGNTIYDTIDLAPGGSLASGQYLVIAGPTVMVPITAKKIDPGWASNQIQNGAPDGIALVNRATHTLIDALSYEGSITNVTLPGFALPVSLVEGTALPANVADSNTADGSLCRHPNGTDSDNASTDWTFCTSLSIGTANP